MKYKQLSEIADIKFSSVVTSRLKKQEVATKWLVCSNFLRDNTIDLKPSEEFFVPDNEQLIHDDDIIVKRIAPTFVNYIDSIPDSMYVGNNLIVISPNQDVYPKYLAMLLNERIESLSESSSVGAVMKSISRQHLEELLVPILSYEKQVLAGDMWYYSIELKKMKQRLIELETIRANYQLKKYVNSFGGRNNG